jgi:hypothetical protein
MTHRGALHQALALIEDNANADQADNARTLREVYALLLEAKGAPSVIPAAARFREEQVRRDERAAAVEKCWEVFRAERAQVGESRALTHHDLRMQGAAECARRILETDDDDARTVPVRRSA